MQVMVFESSPGVKQAWFFPHQNTLNKFYLLYLLYEAMDQQNILNDRTCPVAVP